MRQTSTIIPILITAATLVTILATTSPANAQACNDEIDPHGEVGVYNGRPVVDYIVYDCTMTPVGIRANTSRWSA